MYACCTYAHKPCTVVHVTRITHFFSENVRLREQSVVVLKIVEDAHDCTVFVVWVEWLETDVFQRDVRVSAIRKGVGDLHVDEMLLKEKGLQKETYTQFKYT